MELVYRHHLSSGNEALDTDMRDLQVVTLASGRYLYAATGQGGGITTYRISEFGAAATVHDTDAYGSDLSGMAIGELEVLTIDGTRQLVVGGLHGNGIGGFRLNNTGSVGYRMVTDLPGGLRAPSAIASLGDENTDVVFTVDQAGGLLNAFDVNGNSLIRQGIPSDERDDFTLDGEVQLATATIGARHFVLAADSGGDGVSSYRVMDPNSGSLRAMDRLGAEQGLGLNTPSVMQTVTAHGATWVIVGSSESGSLSVMRLFYDGHLEATDHILDSRDTRFDAISAMDIVRVGDQVFVIAGGGDDGLSLLTLLPDGQLLHLQSIANSGTNGLDNVSAIAAVVTGNRIQVFVTSASTGGVSQFEIDIGNTGSVIRDETPGSQAYWGGSGDDVLVGRLGTDLLYGGGGDDILVSGYGRGQLTGGSGRDIFVVRYDTGSVRIEDFAPRQDRLDLSHLPMLRNIGQLTITSTANGAHIVYGEMSIIITSADGTPLSTADIFPYNGGSLGTPDRAIVLNGPYDPDLEPGDTGAGLPRTDVGAAPPGGWGDDNGSGTNTGGSGTDTAGSGGGADSGADSGSGGGNTDPSGRPAPVPGRTITGNDASQVISGTAGDDIINAAGGHDKVYSGAGNDTINLGWGNDVAGSGDGWDLVNGGWGNDTVFGGAGNDTLRGGGGRDELWGGDGDDLVEGEDGNDKLGGGTGNDTINGGAGDDTVYAFRGDDRIGGGHGNDEIWGGAGNDTIWGGPGSDTIGGFTGDDVIYGGWHADIIYGGAGHDKLYGDGGHDKLYAGIGNDTLFGGWGNDTIFGGSGNDFLAGDGGDDELWGGEGDDIIIGGTGNDIMAGGADADVFVFRAGHMDDRIADFAINEDLLRIDIDGLGYANLRISASGGNTVISTGEGTITLLGVSRWTLDADDFLFG